MKKLLSALLILACVASMMTSCLPGIESYDNEQEFYTLANSTYILLDDVAQDVYDYWRASIYDDEFNGDINYAYSCALEDNEATVDKIYENTEELEILFNKIKNGKLKSEVRAVMEAYNEYYFLVFESTCSFNEYSDQRNPLRQELSRALKNLSYEL